MILGSGVVIISVDEAEKLLKAIYDVEIWDKKKIRRLQKLDCLDVVSQLKSIVRNNEDSFGR